MDFDEVLHAVGSFGRYQKGVLAMLFLSVLTTPFLDLMFAFIQYESEFHCELPTWINVSKVIIKFARSRFYLMETILRYQFQLKVAYTSPPRVFIMPANSFLTRQEFQERNFWASLLSGPDSFC